jgi:hypothetical protein
MAKKKRTVSKKLTIKLPAGKKLDLLDKILECP